MNSARAKAKKLVQFRIFRFLLVKMNGRSRVHLSCHTGMMIKYIS